MVLKLHSFLVAVQEAHFVPNFSKCSRIWSHFFWMQCNPSPSMYSHFPGQLGTWLKTDTQVFPAFDCPVFLVVSHYCLQNILLGQQKVRDTQPGPPVVPWVYCWFASSLLLVTECTRKEITIFYHFWDTAWRLKHSFLKLCATCHYCCFYPRTDRSE